MNVLFCKPSLLSFLMQNSNNDGNTSEQGDGNDDDDDDDDSYASLVVEHNVGSPDLV